MAKYLVSYDCGFAKRTYLVDASSQQEAWRKAYDEAMSIYESNYSVSAKLFASEETKQPEPANG